MLEAPTQKTEPAQPPVYQIRIGGHLDDHWSDWLGGLIVTREENGDTLLSGPVVDQAALFGLLKKVRDLGLTLVSVNRIEPAQPERSSAPLETEASHEREDSKHS